MTKVLVWKASQKPLSRCTFLAMDFFLPVKTKVG